MAEDERVYLREEKEALMDRIAEAPPEEAEELKKYLRETEEEIERTRGLVKEASEGNDEELKRKIRERLERIRRLLGEL